MDSRYRGVEGPAGVYSVFCKDGVFICEQCAGQVWQSDFLFYGMEERSSDQKIDRIKDREGFLKADYERQLYITTAAQTAQLMTRIFDTCLEMTHRVTDMTQRATDMTQRVNGMKRIILMTSWRNIGQASME